MSRRRPILWNRVVLLIAMIVVAELVSNWLFGGGLWQAYSKFFSSLFIVPDGGL